MKKILLAQFGEHLPSFPFWEYRNGCYHFQRLREFRGRKVFETLHVIFSLADRNFACSVSSRLNPDYLRSRTYDQGLLNPHSELLNLKAGSRILNLQDAYYFHNGRVRNSTLVASQIVDDFVRHGVPFLDSHYKRLGSSALVAAGMDFIEGLRVNPIELGSEIREELSASGFLLEKLSHPLYLELKGKLASVPGVSSEDREWIPREACTLLELYSATGRGSGDAM